MLNHGIDALSGSLRFISTELPLYGIAVVVGTKGRVIIASVFMGFTQGKGEVIFVGAGTIERRILALHDFKQSVIKLNRLEVGKAPVGLTGAGFHCYGTTIGVSGLIALAAIAQCVTVTGKNASVIWYFLEHLGVLLVGVLKASGHR